MGTEPRTQVFISYSHKDKRWLDDLLTHLKPYLRACPITAWSDKQIQPGSKWFEEIKSALAATKVAVLLVTPHFLASDFIHEHELLPLLKEAEREGVTILWIHIRASSYQQSPLRHYQAVIETDVPLAQMKAERDAAWVRICKEIERAAKSSVGPRQPRGPRTAGREPSTLRVVGGAPAPSERGKWRPLDRLIRNGRLRDSVLAPIVRDILTRQADIEKERDVEWSILATAILASEEYFVRVRPSAGTRDWQRDFATVAAPTLVAVAHSFRPSPDSQTAIKQLCDAFANRLRVRLGWPTNPDEYNDLLNSIYRACKRATELESDDVLLELKGLPVIGPE
jgi:hypothetical protein